MSFDVEGLLDLWTRPVVDVAAARTAFGRWYADPVVLNGRPVALDALVDRAVALQAAFETLTRQVDALVETADHVVLAFRMGGRQTGPLPTSAGVLAATSRVITLRVVDVLTLRDGVVSDITMVADELGGLAAVGAVRLS